MLFPPFSLNSSARALIACAEMLENVKSMNSVFSFSSILQESTPTRLTSVEKKTCNRRNDKEFSMAESRTEQRDSRESRTDSADVRVEKLSFGLSDERIAERGRAKRQMWRSESGRSEQKRKVLCEK